MADGYTQTRQDDGTLLLTCTDVKCLYTMRFNNFVTDEDAQAYFQHHADQHAEGKTPSLRMFTITVTGDCTNCHRYFRYELADADDRIWCPSCSASWTLDGADGRTDLTPEEG